MSAVDFHLGVLELDAEAEAKRIAARLHEDVLGTLRRSGVVIGVSGGVDSAVALGLGVQALGPDRVHALLLPERESSTDSLRLGNEVCRHFGVAPEVEDITGALEGFGCYRRRDEAVRAVFPEYDGSWGLKITLPSDLLERDTLSVFSVTVVDPDGVEQRRRLGPAQFRQIVAATNFKQRARAAMLYHHAELRNYAVVGTPPKNEQDLGFFVKYGDSAMDVRPIAHLYKTQVYQLAAQLGVPEEVRTRPPTSDTYSAGSTQEEFFFRLPFAQLDLLWYGWEHDVPAARVATVMGLEPVQVERAYGDFARKTRTTAYLRMPPLPAPARELGDR